jgi:hypothetical protein
MNRILPEGYYVPDENNPHIVRICQGPYLGLKIHISENIKIREDVLTKTPNLCYSYMILDYATFEKNEVDFSVSLKNIVGAIAVEMLSEEVLSGAKLERFHGGKSN